MKMVRVAALASVVFSARAVQAQEIQMWDVGVKVGSEAPAARLQRLDDGGRGGGVDHVPALRSEGAGGREKSGGGEETNGEKTLAHIRTCPMVMR